MKTLIFLLAVIGACFAVEFKIINYHGGPIWVGIQGNSGQPHLEGGGFNLNQGETKSIYSSDNWSGRFWARTWCNGGNNHCATGDCGNRYQCNGAGGQPPATLVEINLRGSGGQDFYDISLVDGFNSMAAIRPINGRGNCPSLECKRDLNQNCPNDLRVWHDRYTVGCKSACVQTNDPRYCCTGQYGTADTCRANDWPANINSARYFKDNCPQAYSYAYDDKSSLFTCTANAYQIEFG